MAKESNYTGAVMFGHGWLKSDAGVAREALNILENSEDTISKGGLSVMMGYRRISNSMLIQMTQIEPLLYEEDNGKLGIVGVHAWY